MVKRFQSVGVMLADTLALAVPSALIAANTVPVEKSRKIP
jgi:hypothetical protein